MAIICQPYVFFKNTCQPYVVFKNTCHLGVEYGSDCYQLLIQASQYTLIYVVRKISILNWVSIHLYGANYAVQFLSL